MHNETFYLILILALILTSTLLSQEVKSDGPVIEGFGHVWDVENIDFETDTNKVYKVIFDIYNTPEDNTSVNPQINTVARFINMHVAAGVPLEQLEVAAVFHNKASKDILQNSHYQQRFGVSNPNESLIQQLMNNNVKLLFCGQSSYSRNIPKEEIIENIQLALSAMTAILSYSDNGFTLIRF